ncbi:hypothetical protein AB0K60_10945 [Thermopolyspora sp. NPDC052614]|uniref:hypothetical protein n=1 Tax=Thermopolyspora sp. NPDC052614 TaxID=3155682 RepID=UPI003440B72D
MLGIGFAARRAVRTSLDFFLSGRSLPAWIIGPAFVSANLGAIEILGMAANGAQYGAMTLHYRTTTTTTAHPEPDALTAPETGDHAHP